MVVTLEPRAQAPEAYLLLSKHFSSVSPTQGANPLSGAGKTVNLGLVMGCLAFGLLAALRLRKQDLGG